MTTILLYTFGSVLLISAISLVGVFTLSLRDDLVRAGATLLVGLAIGALLGDAFLHLIPEAFESTSNASLLSLTIISGILAFFVIEKFLHWHHHQGIEDAEDAVHPFGKLIFVSDGVHNFIDGLIIAASYFVSIEVGIATTIAVILHEIPQEIGDFGVLLHAGYTKSRALFLNFASALFAFAGAGIAVALGSATESFAMWLVPLAAGGFIYIALSDLIPELHKSKSARHAVLQLLTIIIGVAAMAALLLLEA